MYEKNIERWITAHPGGNKEAEGQPIPVKKGQTNKEATESFFAKKSKFKAKNPESKEREEFVNKMKSQYMHIVSYLNNEEYARHPNMGKDNFKIKDKDIYEQGEILGVKRGNVMSFEQADNNSVNPKYNDGDGYNINCQACVSVFEARLRGYDLEALPFNSEDVDFIKVAINPEIVYENPKIKKLPLNKTTKYGEENREDLTIALHKNINNNERFNMIYSWMDWDSGEMGNHILEVHKIDNKIVIYDPQSNHILDDINNIGNQIGNIKIFRVDNLKFKTKVLSKICKKRSKG